MIAIFGHKLFDRKCKYTNKIEQHIKHTNTLKYVVIEQLFLMEKSTDLMMFVFANF